MSKTGWIILLCANLPTYWLLGWVVFREWEEFWECVRFWLTPDWLSGFRGEYFEDMWAEMRLFFWLVLCAGTIYGEWHIITKVIMKQ